MTTPRASTALGFCPAITTRAMARSRSSFRSRSRSRNPIPVPLPVPVPVPKPDPGPRTRTPETRFPPPTARSRNPILPRQEPQPSNLIARLLRCARMDEPREFVIPVQRRWTLWILPTLAILYFLVVLALAVLRIEIRGLPSQYLVLAGVAFFLLGMVIQLPFFLRRSIRAQEPEPFPENGGRGGPTRGSRGPRGPPTTRSSSRTRRSRVCACSNTRRRPRAATAARCTRRPTFPSRRSGSCASRTWPPRRTSFERSVHERFERAPLQVAQAPRDDALRDAQRVAQLAHAAPLGLVVVVRRERGRHECLLGRVDLAGRVLDLPAGLEGPRAQRPHEEAAPERGLRGGEELREPLSVGRGGLVGDDAGVHATKQEAAAPDGVVQDVLQRDARVAGRGPRPRRDEAEMLVLVEERVVVEDGLVAARDEGAPAREGGRGARGAHEHGDDVVAEGKRLEPRARRALGRQRLEERRRRPPVG